MNRTAIEAVKADCAAVVAGRVEELAPLKKGTLVVTGGTGFVGTWLAELVAHLNDAHGFGVQMVLIARSTDRFGIACPHLATRSDVRLVKSDVRHMIEVPKETNWFVHAAGTPDSRLHATNPLETMTVIADGTDAVLRAVDRCNDLRMFLNVSSGLVYGPQPLDLERVAETFHGAPAAASVSSAYAEAKRYAETLCSAARSQARIPLVIARPFAFIGPYQPLDMPFAINNFIRDALAGKSIRVFGDGQTVRSYMYPSDMAFWLLRILTGGTSGLVYNVGSLEGNSLESAARMVASLFDPQPEIVLRTAGAVVNRSRLVPDTTLCASSLKLSSTVGLRQALEKTIAWHRSAETA